MPVIPGSSVGKKILMAITGQVMILFVVAHMVGNATIYFGRLNAYAEQLHSLPLILWIYRTVMFALLLLHAIVGIQLYLENRKSKPQAYSIRKRLSTTFAGKTVIWTGLVIGVFLVYHLLHFTFQVVNTEIPGNMLVDRAGRTDVFRMVAANFRNIFISSIYIVAMIALLLHLIHGIQSSFQTLGLSNERTLPSIEKTGSIIAFVLFLCYISIPIIIYFGIMKG
jgi:succinate dehydrogenase / fumarate reductase cytochrome b subunit